METRRIGSLDVSLVGLGTNNFGMTMSAEEVTPVVHAALDAGVTYIDTADVYGRGLSEERIGAALNGRRAEAVIATKFGAPSGVPKGMASGSADWVREACEASLRRLGTDYIDHFQVHYHDPNTPMEETLGALHELVTAGKVREIGSSNSTAAHLDESVEIGERLGISPFRSVQNRYSVLHRAPETDGVLDACRRHGIGFVPYFPLELGILTGKYKPGEAPPQGSRLATWDEKLVARFNDPARVAAAERLGDWAADHGHTLVELAFSWLACQPQIVSIIAGATKPAQVETNAHAAAWTLSAEDLAEIDALVAG
jgi:aryl-alcohol dehydrogenase-like predicted oxidoreductase